MPKKETQETFAVSDKVVWKMDEIDSYMNKQNLKDYGNGPFDIVEIKHVPIGLCACGAPLGRCYGVFSGNPCNQTMRESAGHHQRVCISCNGKVITVGCGNNKIQTFSGGWFKKV